MRRIRKVTAAIVALAMIIMSLPVIGMPVNATDDLYYEEFGITYEQLFTLYPNYLAPEQETAVVSTIRDSYIEAMDDYGGIYDFLPSFFYALKEGGANIIAKKILSDFGLDESLQEELITDTSEALMREILQIEDGFGSVTNEISNNFSKIDNAYDVATTAGKSIFANDLKKACSNLSDNDVDKVADALFEKESDLVGKIGDGIEFWQLIVGIVQMHELQVEAICQFRDSLGSNSDLAIALDALLAELNKDPVTYILEYYCTDYVLNELSEAIQTIALASLKGKFSASMLTVAAANIIISIAVAVYPGAMADEVYQTTLLSEYVSEIDTAIIDYKTEFMLKKAKGELVGQDDIDEFEYLYNAYIVTISETLKSARNIAKGDNLDYLETAIALCEQFTYDKYITWCMVNVRADINSGVISAPGGEVDNSAVCIKETEPCYGRIVIAKDETEIMDRPCSARMDVNAQLIETVSSDTEYIATGLYLNVEDEYWYRVATGSGKTGYICSEDCVFTEFLSDVTVTGLDVPAQIDVGDRYWIKGTVSTRYTEIAALSFLVYDQSGTVRTGKTINVTGNIYVLDNSALDAAVEFNVLPAGTYQCVIEARLENLSATECWAEKVILHTSELVVGSEVEENTTAKYSDLLLDINWTHIDKVGRQTPGSYSCSCFALAYSRTILDNTVHYFYEYNQKGNTEYEVWADWTWGNHNFTTYNSDIEVFERLYQELCKGKPVIIYVKGNNSDGHYVTVVGFQNVLSLENLSESNFLIIDPVVSYGHVAVDLAYAGYSLRQDYRQVVYDESSAKVSFTVTNNPICDHKYSLVDTATCTEAGLRDYTCTLCGYYYSEQIEAYGHNYEAVRTEATCTMAGYTTYTCSRCGDYYVELEDGWSEWTTEYPAGIPEELIEEKTQYSILVKEYTTSTEAMLDGWTFCGTTYGDWGAVQTATTKPTEGDMLRITNTVQTGWGYYHWCNYYYNGGNNWNIDSIEYGSPSYWHGYTSSFALPAISFSDKGGQQAYGGYGTGAAACAYNFYIWFRNPGADVYTYSYQTRSVVNQFYRWSDEWSDWSDEEVTSSEDRQVKTQTVYRYYIGDLGSHDYDDVVTAPTCTEQGYTTHTCTNCGDSYVDNYTQVTEHSYGEWYETKSPTCTDPGTERHDCENCDHYETQEVAGVGHTPGAPVVENDNGNGSHDEVVYCSECGEELSRKHIGGILYGDINGDGKVNIFDANLAASHYNEIVELNAEQLVAADVNGDGKVNIFDANLIAAYYNEVISIFPIENK